MDNVVPIIRPDSFDFKAYMEETEPQIKVLPAESWKNDLLEFLRHGDELTGATLPWGKTHSQIRFRGGEVTLWQGINGHGKSQMLGMAALWFAAQNERVCIASFEMRPVSTLIRMLRQFSTTSQPSESILKEMTAWTKDRIWLYDQLGSVTPDMLYAVIRYCATELKVKHFVIDSLMKCVKGEDDYNGQKDFVDMLTSLARDHNIHVHLVHHVRKGENEDRPPGKFDSRGAASITDQVDQVLTVWRNKKKERAVELAERNGDHVDDKTVNSPDALLICDKNRHGEWEGSIALWYHAASLQYTSDSRRLPLDITKVQA